MEEQKSEIEKYINEKKELQKLVLQIIEKSESDDNDFLMLINHLDTHQYKDNKPELKHFLGLLSNISINHHRGPIFFKQIEKILKISSKYYKPVFSNDELMTIILKSKPIILILIQTKIITLDSIIFKYLLNYTVSKDDEIYYYFYPELKTVIKSGTIEGFDNTKYKIKMNDDIENFETNRQVFENDAKICSIIRDDLIDDFIQYVNVTNISLSGEIRHSIFETNSILTEKDPSLIEYAFFFGSIRIIKYLEINDVELTPSLWLYAVHSNNSEAIQFLLDKKIELDDRAFSEAIKCYHNDVAYYIRDNLMNESDLNDENNSIIYLSSNYEFFSNEIDGNNVFFNLCQSENTSLVDFYLSSNKEEIENYIKQGENTQQMIKKSLKENRLDAAYYLFLRIDCIQKNCFQYDQTVTKISLPSSIKSIGNYAFYECKLLKQISIPLSVTSIGIFSFAFCSSLTKVFIPSSVASIGENAFNGCKSLTNVSFVFPSSLFSIEEKTFCNCTSLKEITIPSSVTSIENNAFCECSSLSCVSFEIPSLINYIGEYAFQNCKSLCNVYLPNISFLSEIKKYAFDCCSSLRQISIPHSVTKIEEMAFSGCESLILISFADHSSLVEIGKNAFFFCSSLSKISIPSSVTKIGENAFLECESLLEISIPSSIDIDNLGIDEDTNVKRF